MKVKYYLELAAAFMLSVSTLANADEIYRLPDSIVPQQQIIQLRVDPDQLDFSGETWIDLDITKTTDKVGFYHIDLTLEKVELVQGENVIPLEVSGGEYDIFWGSAGKPLPPGTYQLHIRYRGKVNTSSDGMYLSRFEDRNYIFTQFEDMEARRAFPSFDQPNFKIPYQLTIESPEKHTVLSNTPVEKRQVEAGWQKVRFQKTKPMPTYLVAYAIGEFDSAEITGLSVPGKVYTPYGQAHRTRFVIQHTPAILKALEDYFGIPYPYAKLDFVAVPNFTHGAMENAGLITYRSSLLLLEDEPGLSERSGPLDTIAHELAHQWYGNLVTMAWWDDLWLNEAFASWMASKVMMQLYPELNFHTRIIQEGAFTADASPTTKPVKKLVRSSADVMDGLGLNYSKGESILNMIEALIGEKAFQKAVQTYMQKHKWGNTTADDLWAVLGDVADFDVPAMMRTYLEQPGYPLVEFEANGAVSQRRYHLAGAEVKPQVWNVPVAISYKKNGKIHRQMMFLNEPRVLNSQLAEADWIYPNDNAMGYYRWKISSRQMETLLSDIDVLNVREKKNLLYNSDALLKAGEISLQDHMQVLDVLAQEQDPTVVSAVVAALNDLLYLVDDSNRQVFARFVAEKLMPWYRKLGVGPQPGDSEEIIKLRQAVFSILSQHAPNEELEQVSKKMTRQYLEDPGAVSRHLASAALKSTAKFGAADWYHKYRQAYLKSSDANVRNTLMGSMYFPQDENVRQLLDFSFHEEMSPANVIYNLYVASKSQEKQDLLYSWLDKHFQQLTERMPSYHIGRMPEFVSSSCDQHNVQLARAFYPGRMEKFDGMARSFEVAMDEANQCLALKDRFQAEFTRYLEQVPR
ncbi:M1 family metallopeptidase [Bowmanella dokdonensis]|uniref:Aminopeptidase n=1 Tax=Bowmanella dokdonensis TaxID=751969 RepID=A0A939DQ84_9ALTE|nr:M1 family metallopeptidase [Bowmanella dokdonensis]MBN7825926.1 M1 family metallopeptidase [Bowmanella dokdonensis]